MIPGDCYWVELTSIGWHLCVVLTHPDDEHGGPLPGARVWVTTFSGWTAAKSQHCVVEPHEYECLTKKSVIMYRNSRVFRVEFIKRFGRSCPSVPSVLLDRIVSGARDSDELPIGCWELMEKQGLFDPPATRGDTPPS